MARELAGLSGKSVTYTPTDGPGFEALIRGRGVPEGMVRLIHGFDRDIGDGQLDGVTPELEGLLGRKPASLREGIRELFDR